MRLAACSPLGAPQIPNRGQDGRRTHYAEDKGTAEHRKPVKPHLRIGLTAVNSSSMPSTMRELQAKTSVSKAGQSPKTSWSEHQQNTCQNRLFHANASVPRDVSFGGRSSMDFASSSYWAVEAGKKRDMAGTAAVSQRRAEHIPPLPGGKGRTSSVRKAAPLIRRCSATFPRGEGMVIHADTAAARHRRACFEVQTQQLEACENQQYRNDNIRYAGDDVVRRSRCPQERTAAYRASLR